MFRSLYSCEKECADVKQHKNDITKEKTEEVRVEKIQDVFRPDKNSIGRLVNRRQGSVIRI